MTIIHSLFFSTPLLILFDPPIACYYSSVLTNNEQMAKMQESSEKRENTHNQRTHLSLNVISGANEERRTSLRCGRAPVNLAQLRQPTKTRP